MKTQLRRKRRFVVVATLVVFVFFLLLFGFYILTPEGRRIQRQAIADRTHAEIARIALAVKSFHDLSNHWPISLSELQTNPQQVRVEGGIRDLWGRDYIYSPPNGNEPGKIETFGADGSPFGDKFDGDATVRLE
jgi:hypothetical protein